LALNPVVSSAAGSSLGKGGNHPPADYGPVIAAVGCSVQSSAIDLVINALGFNPVRHAVYTIANCGRTATNLPFVVDVYMNGQRADTIEQKILPGRSQQTVTSSLAIDQGCSETTLLAIADPQKVITESSSESHQKTVQVSPPCPNLVVTDIKQVWEDLNTRYEVQFTIQNQGSGPPPIAITATESVAYDDAVLIPYDNYYQLEPLQPGQSVTFHDSKKHMMTETIDVEIILDMQHQISVVNPNNNISKKTLGPH
jgi:subtilase family serine protease